MEEEKDKYTKWVKRKTVFKSHVPKMDNKIEWPVICVHLCVYTEWVTVTARDDETLSWRVCVRLSWRVCVCVFKVLHMSKCYIFKHFLHHYTTALLVKCYIFKHWLYRIIIRALLVNCYIFGNWFYTIMMHTTALLLKIKCYLFKQWVYAMITPQHFWLNATVLNIDFW